MELFVAAARFIHYAAAHQVYGLSAFLCFLAPPDLQAAIGKPSKWLARLCALLVLLSGIAWLMATAGTMGNGISDTINPDVIGKVLTLTEFGRVWGPRLIICTILLLATLLPGTWSWWVIGPLATLALGTLGLVGHAAMDTGVPGLLNRGSQILHLLSSGFWLGALVPLLLCLARYNDPRVMPGVNIALHHFSGLGHFAVALLIFTGVVNTWFVWGVSLDFHSPYGLGLLAKVAIAGMMCLLAIVNRYVFVPRMANGGPGTRELAYGTMAEIVLGTAILALVAVIGVLPPR